MSDEFLLLVMAVFVFWLFWRSFFRGWIYRSPIYRMALARFRAHQIPDEAYYEMAGAEIQRGTLRQGLWLKALSEARGNEDEARALYIKFRVDVMRAEAAEFLGKASDRINNYSSDDEFYSEPVERIIVNCPKCNGKLRVAAAKLLDISCSHCGKKFRLHT